MNPKIAASSSLPNHGNLATCKIVGVFFLNIFAAVLNTENKKKLAKLVLKKTGHAPVCGI